jgi:cellulose synthase/poly-beta-1,6-N-acetylglucosamine synthase-like glycosyltransferase
MGLNVLVSQRSELERGFSIGICAADRATNLAKLLQLIQTESYPNGMELKKIILVASGCEPGTLAEAREMARKDDRFVLVEEPARRGKSIAINQIMDAFEGRFLVLVNSDALPERGAIPNLLETIARDNSIGMISASPVVDQRAGITSSVLQLMWGVHNECLFELNQADRNNHCCDELIVSRSDALGHLPLGTINDGAFLAGNAYRAGYAIRFSEEARVKIDVPRNFYDLIRQRRRIVYGHFQIWKSVGDSPRTLESMLLSSPSLSFSILVKVLAKTPRLILALPVALIGEVISIVLAMHDNRMSSTKYVTWERFGNRS